MASWPSSHSHLSEHTCVMNVSMSECQKIGSVGMYMYMVGWLRMKYK